MTLHDLTWSYKILRDLHIHTAITSPCSPRPLRLWSATSNPKSSSPSMVVDLRWLWRLSTFSNFWLWGWEVEICFIIWYIYIWHIFCIFLYIWKIYIDVRYVKLFQCLQVDFFDKYSFPYVAFCILLFKNILPQDFMVLLRFPTTGRDLWKRFAALEQLIGALPETSPGELLSGSISGLNTLWLDNTFSTSGSLTFDPSGAVWVWFLF